jgi:hypothetical protein
MCKLKFSYISNKLYDCCFSYLDGFHGIQQFVPVALSMYVSVYTPV